MDKTRYSNPKFPKGACFYKTLRMKWNLVNS